MPGLRSHVPRHLDVAHHFANLDELRGTRVRVSFETPAFRPPIRLVVIADVAEQQTGSGLVDDQPQAATDPHRPEVLVLGPVHPVELHPRLSGIDLQIERRCLRGPLLLARELCETLGERIGYPKEHLLKSRVGVPSSPPPKPISGNCRR